VGVLAADCRVGPTALGKNPLIPLLCESNTDAAYVDVDCQKVQTASRFFVVVGCVVRVTLQVIEGPDPEQVQFALL
jgi:hypothetical protein